MWKLAGESCAGIWKLPKELSDLGGSGWNELKNPSDGGRGGINGGGGGNPGPWPRPGGSTGVDGRGEILLLSGGSCLSLNLFNRFLRA